MLVVQNLHHVLWIREHWKLDGIVGGGAVSACATKIKPGPLVRALRCVVILPQLIVTPRSRDSVSRKKCISPKKPHKGKHCDDDNDHGNGNGGGVHSYGHD